MKPNPTLAEKREDIAFLRLLISLRNTVIMAGLYITCRSYYSRPKAWLFQKLNNFLKYAHDRLDTAIAVLIIKVENYPSDEELS